MSELTFNIADYRPLFAVRTHRDPGRSAAPKRPAGFVVLSSSDPEGSARWMDSSPEIFDIRMLRDEQRTRSGGSHSRRGKILRFTTEPHCRVYVMNSAHPAPAQADSDATDEPPAA